MMKSALKLGVMNDIVNCVFSFECDLNFLSEKQALKKAVYERESNRWKATCLMYSSLDIFRKAHTSISLNCWWYFVKIKPVMFKKVSSVVAVLMGTQPSGLQRNHGIRCCGLCGTENESTIHVLFDCNKLRECRSQMWNNVTESMPEGLKLEMDSRDNTEKAIMLLSGFGQSFIHEWTQLYSNSARFVHTMYKKRSQLYDELASDQNE